MPAPFNLRAIGVIRSPFVEAAGTPIQPCYAQGAEGKVLVDEFFAPALDDIEGFERVWLIYWLDRITGFKTHVVRLLNQRQVDLVAQVGLCIGHDLILQEECEAPVTTLVAKDRALETWMLRDPPSPPHARG